MATVADLLPGDLVTQGDMSAVFLTRTEHPLWATLDLVIWRLPDGTWSLDALSAYQEVGDVTVSTGAERKERVRGALLGIGGGRG